MIESLVSLTFCWFRQQSQKTCICPQGERLKQKTIRVDQQGYKRICFQGRKLQCKACPIKTKYMKTPPAQGVHQEHGRQVSYIINKTKKGTYTDWIARRIDTGKGKQIYGHRMSVVEPVFGNLSVNKKLNRFSLRGREKVNSQWQLFCMVQNIEKLAKYAN